VKNRGFNMSFLRKIREALFPSPLGISASEGPSRTSFRETLHSLAEAGKLLEPPAARVQPPIPFSDVLAAYFADPACKAAVHELAFAAVGKGFYHTVNPEYEKADDVGEVVDKFNEKANLDAILIVAAIEVVATGNHFWLIGDLENKTVSDSERPIKPIPLTAIESIELAYLHPQIKIHNQVKSYNLRSSWGGGQLNPERVVHLRWNPVNNSPFGYGVIHSLLDEANIHGTARESYLAMKWKIEQQSIDIHQKYAGPDQLWILPKAKAEDAANLKALLKSRPKEGARFVFSGQDGDIKSAPIDPRAGFSYIVDHIMNQNYLGLETPLAKALTTPGFTEASIRGAIELHEPVIFAMQRLIKREVEKLWSLVIAEAGFDPAQAHARLNWGTPETPEILVADMLKAAELGLIRPEEFRKNAVKFGWELWDKEPEETAEVKKA
jgi:hypothetical protein